MWFIALLALYAGFTTLSDTINNPKFSQPDFVWWSVGHIVLSVILIAIGLGAGILEWLIERKKNEAKKVVYLPAPIQPTRDAEDNDDDDVNIHWKGFFLLTRTIPFRISQGDDFLVDYRRAADEAINACFQEFDGDYYEDNIVSIVVEPMASTRLWGILKVQYHIDPDDLELKDDD